MSTMSEPASDRELGRRAGVQGSGTVFNKGGCSRAFVSQAKSALPAITPYTQHHTSPRNFIRRVETAASEQRHVPNRHGCKSTARHAELSRRPRPCHTVVQVHGIKHCTCKGWHKKSHTPHDKKAHTRQRGATTNFASSRQRTAPCTQPTRLQAERVPRSAEPSTTSLSHCCTSPRHGKIRCLQVLT